MIRSPTSSPAAQAKTPPPSFMPPALRHLPPGPRSPAWRWLRNDARRSSSLNLSRLPLFHRRQVDCAMKQVGADLLAKASADGETGSQEAAGGTNRPIRADLSGGRAEQDQSAGCDGEQQPE